MVYKRHQARSDIANGKFGLWWHCFWISSPATRLKPVFLQNRKSGVHGCVGLYASISITLSSSRPWPIYTARSGSCFGLIFNLRSGVIIIFFGSLLLCVAKAKIAQNNSQVCDGGIAVKPGQDYIPNSWIDYLKSESVCRFCNLYPVSNCIQMIG